jgi:hypothetical protein
MNDLRKAAGEALEALEALEDVPYMSNKDDYERLESHPRKGKRMNREDIMTLVERYALAMRLVDRHGNQYGDRDLLTLTHQQIRGGLKALVVSEREACAKVCENKNTLIEWPTYAAAIRARGNT